MIETAHYRISEVWAEQNLPWPVGQSSEHKYPNLPAELRPLLTRSIDISTSDPIFAPLHQLIVEARRQNCTNVGAVWVTRKYTQHELANASLFHLAHIHEVNFTCGDHGTEYQSDEECPACGFGRTLIGSLKLPVKQMPKGIDLVWTQNRNQILCTSRFADTVIQAGLTGARFRAVIDTATNVVSNAWLQLEVPPDCLSLIPPSQCGDSFLNLDPSSKEITVMTSKAPTSPQKSWWMRLFSTSEITATNRNHVCPQHLYRGLRILTEAFVGQAEMADFMATRDRMGVLSYDITPSPLLLISPSAHKVLLEKKLLKGVRIEVGRMA